jgi:pantetheine-phosphate adenylyltransferase
MDRIAVFAGSLDPITNGHLGIIATAVRLFPKVYVCLAVNAMKTKTLFTVEQRIELARLAVAPFQESVIVDSTTGLLVDYMQHVGAHALVRGLRDGLDLAQEWRIEDINLRICRARNYTFDTVYLRPDTDSRYVSSSVVRELIGYGDWPVIRTLVPPGLEDVMKTYLVALEKGGIENKNPHFSVFLLLFLD